MAEKFLPFAKIKGVRYWFIRPKEEPEKLYAVETESKVYHEIPEVYFKSLGLSKDLIKVRKSPGILGVLKPGTPWDPAISKFRIESPKEIKWEGLAPKIPKPEIKPITKPEPLKLPETKRLEKPILYPWIQQIKFGQRSERVKQVQRELKKMGYFPKDVPETGYYGKITKSAIEKYLKDIGVPKVEPIKEIKIESPEEKLKKVLGKSVVETIKEVVSKTQKIQPPKVEKMPEKEVLERAKEIFKIAPLEVPKPLAREFLVKFEEPYLKAPTYFKEEELTLSKKELINTEAKQLVEKFEEKFIGEPTKERLNEVAKRISELKIRKEKEYQDDPEYWTNVAIFADLKMAAELEELARSSKGVYWDEKEGRIKLSEDLKRVQDLISKHQDKLSEIGKKYVEVSEKERDLISKLQKENFNLSSLETEYNRLKSSLVEESKKEMPDIEKITSLNQKIQDISVKYQEAFNRYKNYSSSLFDLDEKRKSLEAEFKKIQAKLEDPKIKKDLALYNAFLQNCSSRLDRIKDYQVEKEQAMKKRYELGVLSTPDYAKFLGLDTQTFFKEVYPKFKDIRTANLKKALALNEKEFQRFQENLKNLYSPKSLAVKTLLSVTKTAWWSIDKALKATLALPSVVLGALNDFRLQLEAMQEEIDEPWKRLYELTDPKTIEKLNDKEKGELAKRVTLFGAFVDSLKDMSSQGKRVFVDYIFKGSGWELTNYIYDNLPIPEQVKEVGGTPMEIAFDLAIWTLLDPKAIFTRFTTEGFHLLDRELVKLLPKGLRKVQAVKLVEGRIQKQAVEVVPKISELVGKSIYHVLGETYTRTFPKYFPTIDHFLKWTFAKAYDKTLPLYVKYSAKHYAAIAKKREEFISEHLDKELGKFLRKLKDDKEFKKILSESFTNGLIPENELAFKFLKRIDPEYYGKLWYLSKKEKIPKDVLNTWLKKVQKVKEDIGAFEDVIRKNVSSPYVERLVIQYYIPKNTFPKALFKLYDEEFKKNVGKFYKPVVEASEALKKIYDYSYKIPYKPGEMVFVTWPSIRGVKFNLNLRYLSGKRFRESFKVISEDLDLLKRYLYTYEKNKKFHLILNESEIQSLADEIGVVVNAATNRWLNKLSEIPYRAEETLSKSFFEALKEHFYKRVKKDDDLKDVASLIGKILNTKDKNRIIREYYSLASEFKFLKNYNADFYNVYYQRFLGKALKEKDEYLKMFYKKFVDLVGKNKLFDSFDLNLIFVPKKKDLDKLLTSGRIKFKKLLKK